MRAVDVNIHVENTNNNQNYNKIDETIVVGADLLGMFTRGLYVGALPIYREYIQNAADSIDRAKESGLYCSRYQPKIKLAISRKERNIRIHDNGEGVPGRKFKNVLTALGASQKRGTQQRGFRGVGRLSGLTYAKTVTFRSKTIKDKLVSELKLDGVKLRKILAEPHWSGSLEDAVKEIASYKLVECNDDLPHFFEVVLEGVANVQNDILLNTTEVENYLSQVAPVSYSPDFSFKEKIEVYLEKYGLNKTYKIFVNDNSDPIYRPYSNRFSITDHVKDAFRKDGIEFYAIPGQGEVPSAVGWFIHHSYLGAIPKESNIHGLRIRVGNIQVGQASILSELFPQQRFNSWTVGEIHVTDPLILPNDGRDDFETSPQYQRLCSHLKHKLKVIGHECQSQSLNRNKIREVESKINDVNGFIEILESPLIPNDVREKRKEEYIREVDKFKQFSLSNDVVNKDVIRLAKKVDECITMIRQVKGKGRNPLNFVKDKKEREISISIIGSLYRVKADIREAHRIATNMLVDMKEQSKR